MNNISNLLRNGQSFINHNSPVILTAIGVTGTISTAVFAAKGGMKAAKLLDERNQETRDAEFTAREQFIDDVKTTWKCYIPALAVGATTVTAIVAANRIGSARATAVASALTLTDKAFAEYREKVVEQIGVNKEQKVRDEVAKDAATRDYPSQTLIISDEKNCLIYEAYSGRYFESNIEALRRAQNDFNQTLLSDMYASLNSFYELIGLDPNSVGEEVGWTVDNMLDLQFTSFLSPDNKAVLSFGYSKLPIPKYWEIA